MIVYLGFCCILRQIYQGHGNRAGDTLLDMHHASYSFIFIALVGSLVVWTVRQSSFVGLYLYHQVGQELFADVMADWHGIPHVCIGKSLTLQNMVGASTLSNDSVSWAKKGHSLDGTKPLSGLVLLVWQYG